MREFKVVVYAGWRAEVYISPKIYPKTDSG